MNIEISNETEGYKIYKNGSLFPLKNLRRSFVTPYLFDDNDIENLLTKAQYKRFETGDYAFGVPASKLQLIAGERSAKTKEELTLYP